MGDPGACMRLSETQSIGGRARLEGQWERMRSVGSTARTVLDALQVSDVAIARRDSQRMGPLRHK